SLKGPGRGMNSLMFHWPGRGRYDFRELRGSAYRPRQDNGSGDSPRPPFLTEFVNQIGECDLVHLIYHLFGSGLRLRIHSHVERPFRLKTKASRGVIELQAAHAEISQNPVVGRASFVVRKICEATMSKLYRWPVPL